MLPKSALLYEKRVFLPLTRPPMPPFTSMSASFSLKCRRSSPDVARIGSETGESFAWNPGIQAHGFDQEDPGARLLCTAATAFSAALCPNAPWKGSLPSNNSLLCPLFHGCPCPPSLSAMMEHTFMPIMPDWHGRLFLLRRGKVRDPKGGSNLCDRIPTDRAALSREFPRN